MHSEQPLTDSSWATNFPNANFNNTDDCGVMVVEPIHSYWKDTTCCSTTIVDQKKVAPICQHDTACPSGWKLFDGHCYQVVEGDVQLSATWAEAEKDCNIKGGHLASVHSAAENAFISSLNSGFNLWIGGTDTAVEVSFTILYMYRQTS
jgi:hypothetical protein